MQSACAVLCGHLWRVWLSNIFPHYVRDSLVLNIKCVIWFSLQLLYETFLILRRTQRYTVIVAHTYSCKGLVVTFIRFQWNSNILDIFQKYSNTKFHQNPSSKERTDRQTWKVRKLDRMKKIQNSIFMCLSDISHCLFLCKETRFGTRLCFCHQVRVWKLYSLTNQTEGTN